MATILHTNDLHNHLSEAQAARLAVMRNELGDRGVLLDAGDAVGSGNVTFRPGGEPILERMARIGYDAMTVGNREFHFTDYGFRCKLRRAAFPVLCANVRRTGAERTDQSATRDPGGVPLDGLVVRPFIMQDLACGMRLVVIGLTVPMITERMLARKLSPFVFDSPVRTAALVVPQLRARLCPDVLVALTHIGYRQDLELARTVPGIDVILGGHSHTLLESGEMVGSTLVAQTGSWAHHLGIVTLERSRGSVRSLRISARTVPF